MTKNINNTMIDKTLNTVYGMDNMLLLKAYIYEKKNRFMTMFTFIPADEYKEVTIFTDKDKKPITLNTNGVYVAHIGSMSGIVSTSLRNPLSVFQKNLEDNGWKFVTTVKGAFGKDKNIVQRMAWDEIRKIRADREKKLTQKESVSSFKAKGALFLNRLKAESDDGLDISLTLDKLRNVIYSVDNYI